MRSFSCDLTRCMALLASAHGEFPPRLKKKLFRQSARATRERWQTFQESFSEARAAFQGKQQQRKTTASLNFLFKGPGVSAKKGVGPGIASARMRAQRQAPRGL